MKIKGKFKTLQIWLDDKELLPERSQAIYNHSPDGFNWGYSGSGPSQLALAICLEAFSQEVAQRIYQGFKWQFVASWPQDDFDVEIDMHQWSQDIIKNTFLEK